MAHRTKTVGPGKDYESLSLALAGEYASDATLTNDTAETVGTFPSIALEVQLYAFEDTTAVVVPAFTVDATHRLLVTVLAGERFAGVWDATKYRLVVNGNALVCARDHVILDGLQVQTTGSDTYAIRFTPSSTTFTGNVFVNCLFRADTGYSAYFEYLGGIVNNCIFDSGTRYGWSSGSGPTATFENCTIVGLTYGWLKTYGGIVFKNCYAAARSGGNGFTALQAPAFVYTTCAASGTTSGSGLTIVPFNTTHFASTTRGDGSYLQLNADGALKDTGTNLAADPAWMLGAVDIAGVARSVWDIGAFEDQAAGDVSGVVAKKPTLMGFVTVMPPDAWAENRPVAGGPHSLPARLFPEDNWWNLLVRDAPLDPDSATYIAYNDTTGPYGSPGAGLTTDWGNNYGLPYCTVSGNYPTVHFDGGSYWTQSDDVGYPIPIQALTEEGWTQSLAETMNDPILGPDRHLLIVDVDRQILYEVYQPFHNATAAPVLYASSQQVVPPYGFWCAAACHWDLTSNATRPDGWTSADVAGLQVLPGLVKYDEIVSGDPITHAHRFTLFGNTSDPPLYVWPATHHGGSWNAGQVPLGTRFRLKASYDISAEHAICLTFLQSLKDYGLIFTDNGMQGQIGGTNDARWGPFNQYPRQQLIDSISRIKFTDLEIVQLGWTAESNVGRVTAAVASVAAAGSIDYAAVAAVLTGNVLAAAASVAAAGSVDVSASTPPYESAAAQAAFMFALMP